MNALITSQHYLDAETVEAKMKAGDFEVQISPSFEIDGKSYAVILDGTHSYYAAIKAGVAPILIEQDKRDNDNVAILDRGDIEGFLEAAHMGEGDYIYADTRRDVW